jgi:nucleotide-binding universal stress UspA family protein
LAATGTIVVGYDGGRGGRDALALGELLARSSGGELIVAHVDHPGESAEIGAEVSTLLERSPVRVDFRALAGGSAARALHGLAEREPGVELVALGSTHRAGLGRVMPGGVADRLLNGAPCSVAVAPRGFADRSAGSAGPAPPEEGAVAPLAPADDLRVIGVGFDGSPESAAALELAARLGSAAAATLRVIAVHVPGGGGEAAVGADLEERLHSAVAELPVELRALAISEQGSPSAVLLSRAEEGIDLLIVGSRGYGPVRAVLVGSVSSIVLSAAQCPVVVTPRSAAAADARPQ